MTEEQYNNVIFKIIRAAISTTETISVIDSLQGTIYYRQSLKKQANLFLKELVRLNDQTMGEVFGVKDDVLFKQMEYQKKFIDETMGLSTEELMTLVYVIQDYKKNKERYIDMLGIKFIEH